MLCNYSPSPSLVQLFSVFLLRISLVGLCIHELMCAYMCPLALCIFANCFLFDFFIYSLHSSVRFSSLYIILVMFVAFHSDTRIFIFNRPLRKCAFVLSNVVCALWSLLFRSVIVVIKMSQYSLALGAQAQNLLKRLLL